MNKKILDGKKKYEGKTFLNNKMEEFTILEYNGSVKVKIKFIKTGTIKTIALGNLLAGKVLDEATLRKNITGKILKNSKGYEFLVIEQNNGKSLIRFQETKYQRWVDDTEAISGKVTDRLSKDVYGIGYLGNQDWDIPYYVKGKNLWKGMLRRCYSKNFRINGKYTKPIVSEEWHSLSIFLNDIKGLKGFDKWIKDIPMHLDKDLLGDSMIYSKQTCLFLTPSENREEQTERYKKK